MFNKRLNILKVAGIKIGINTSWIFIAILLSWTLAAGYFPYIYTNLSHGTYWLMGICAMLGLFACIILHELGHALVAKHYKLPISRITLFIFGGIAEIQKEPNSPKVEFLMAVAGPIVSILLALGMYFLKVIGLLLNWPLPIIGIVGYLALINAVLVIFNLVPAFPLDGGRIFRSILWQWKKDFAWATKISTRLGSSFGFILVFLGIFSLISGNILSGIWFIILGFFLQNAANASQNQFFIKKELEGEKVSKFMKKDFISVSPNITVTEFVEKYIYQSHHHLYPVTENKKLRGYISLKEVKSLDHRDWEKTLVNDIMIPYSKFHTVSPDTSALQALNIIQQDEATTLLVTDNKELVGILTAQDLFKIITLKLELEEKNYE